MIIDEEKQLIELRIKKMDTNKTYFNKIIKLYDKSEPKGTYDEWLQLDYSKKRKFVIDIIKIENEQMISFAGKENRYNPFKTAERVKQLKDIQYKKWGIRK